MQPPEELVRIVNRKRYSTKAATLIAGDDYWDGHNWERHGRNAFLYRTPKGEYFLVTLSQWQGERDTLEPISEGEAITLFEGQSNQREIALTEHRVTYSKAFPNVTVEDA